VLICISPSSLYSINEIKLIEPSAGCCRRLNQLKKMDTLLKSGFEYLNAQGDGDAYVGYTATGIFCSACFPFSCLVQLIFFCVNLLKHRVHLLHFKLIRCLWASDCSLRLFPSSQSVSVPECSPVRRRNLLEFLSNS
jgi:hypothetical protein